MGEQECGCLDWLVCLVVQRVYGLIDWLAAGWVELYVVWLHLSGRGSRMRVGRCCREPGCT